MTHERGKRGEGNCINRICVRFLGLDWTGDFLLVALEGDVQIASLLRFDDMR